MAVKKKAGGRKPGDTNHSLREKRLIAQIQKLFIGCHYARALFKPMRRAMRPPNAEVKGGGA